MNLKELAKEHWGAVLFVLGFVLLCSVYEYGRVMNQPPFPHHLSRQTVGLSFTYTYWEKGNGLFDPQLQHLFADDLTSGRTVAEFPIMYYAIAQLWRITGPSEFVYRALMLLLHFMASYALYLLFRRVLEHRGWAVMAALFFFTSPAIVYFAISFMPDVPSFDLVILAIAVLWLPGSTGQTPARILSAAALFLLAALLKITALMVPLTILLMLIVELLFPRWRYKGNGIFQHRWLLIGSILGILAVTYGWYAWSAQYVKAHGAAFSHSGTWALWDLPPADVLRAWTFGKQVLVYQIFDTPAWIMFGVLLAFLLLHARRVPAIIWIALVALSIGITIYVLLWFITLDAHEYYYIHPMILLMLLLGIFLWSVKEIYPKAFRSVPLRAAFLLLFSYHAIYATNNHLMRTRGNVPFRAAEFLPLFNEHEAHFWDMMQYWSLGPMFTIEPYLRSLGIQRNDLVMCMNDQTVCSSLYLIHQRGWVDFGVGDPVEKGIDERIAAGAKYLLLYQGHWDDRSELQRFMTDQIGEYQGMRVFDLRSLPHEP